MYNFQRIKFKKSFLLNYLTPTSKGTNWYEPPPEGKINNRNIGRILLQFHQFAEIVNRYDLFKKKKIKFLDVGTGNGILPELISKFFKVKYSHGMDPYEDGEHATSWRRGTRKILLKKVLEKIKKNFISYKNYKNFLNYENFSKLPQDLKLSHGEGNWKFKKSHIEKLSTNLKYNLFFLKCIDHIHNWDFLFKEITKRSEKKSLLVIKHNSFFGFNGAHRFASTFIPWGHVILNEKDFIKYAKKFHNNRYQEMINFYYNGLTYPRQSIDDLISILIFNKWKILNIEYSPNKNFNLQINHLGGLNKFKNLVKRNFRNIGLDELSSSRIIITAEKN